MALHCYIYFVICYIIYSWANVLGIFRVYRLPRPFKEQINLSFFSETVVNDVQLHIIHSNNAGKIVIYDVDIKTVGDANVEVHNMISDFITVQTEFGSIVGSKLQGKKISLSSSEGGSVTVQKSIQGEIEINTAKDGCVDAEKCLGTKLDISTENGSVKLGSNYCEKATFTTLDGDLNLSNLHMDNSIDINGKGSLNISCFDGSLQANLGEGSAKIQLARVTDDSTITSNGDVSLTIPDSLDTKVVIKSPALEIDQCIKGTYDKDRKEFIGGRGATTFTVESTKRVQVRQSSWMDTFKLQNTPK